MKHSPLVDAGAALNVDEVRRYSRHVLVPEISIIGQQRVKAAKVLCVGAGGLGSPVLMYLAAAGVGTIGVVDFDVVEESNLQRQIIHGQSDIGTSKAESAKRKIAELNPNVQVITHDVRLDRSNALEILKGYDVIIDGTDNFATRYLINDACVLLSKPNIWGSILRFDGQASVFWSEHGPCYRCLHPTPAHGVPNCAEAGVLGVLCASIASIQATEALKLIIGIGEPLIGELIIFDALDMSFRKIVIKKDPACVVCGVNPTQKGLLNNYEAFCSSAGATQISVVELKTKIDSGDDFLLIDVREASEFEIVRIPGSVLIPLRHFIDGSALKSLPKEKEIIVHCHSGGRSATALSILKNAGFLDVTHVEGGVLAWAKHIDTTCTVY
ncbi:MAG: molybdopterin-synthase adenylyltransferase MoeB [Candidatus Planktophila sp.]|nr:molybdopterin-synthase adenylyltransferase MoeB [Candidatus Planktophila sp.]